jgi:hypothetical protein
MHLTLPSFPKVGVANAMPISTEQKKKGIFPSNKPCSWRSTQNDEIGGAIPGE